MDLGRLMASDYSSSHLERIDWPVPPGPGQPEGTVLTDGQATYFIYPTREASGWVVLQFTRVWSVKYGTPNISELDSHPLCGRAKPGDLSIVHESPWHEEARAMNAVHPEYDEAHWREVHHYLAFLWDYTFECLATGFEAQQMTASLSQVIEQLAGRLQVSRSQHD